MLRSSRTSAMSWLYTVTESWRLPSVSGAAWICARAGAAKRVQHSTSPSVLSKFIGGLPSALGGGIALSYRSNPFRVRGASAPPAHLSSSRSARGAPGLRRAALGAQRLLGALELGHRLLELRELGALALHHFLLGLGEEVLVHELAARALELAQDAVGLARQPQALGVEIDESGER